MTPFHLLLLLLSTLLSPTTAHMQLAHPPPFRSPLNPHTPPASTDYALTSPLRPDGSDYPCKGALTLLGTPAAAPVATWTAGQTYNFTVSGGAAHGGGSCQAALSVDGGRTFRVVHSYEGGCPAPAGGESSFGFAVPGDVGGVEGAVFAWTWFNKVGNREMYMNCAVVDIVAAGGGGGREKVAFGERPGLFRANVGNGCRTVDSVDVKFPDPGPDVDSGAGVVPPVGSCGVGGEDRGGEGGSESGGTSGGSGGGGSGGTGGSGGSSGEVSTPTSATLVTLSPSCSPTGCQSVPHHTSRPTIDPGKGWTPGNDWPDWFQSGASRALLGSVYFVVLISIIIFAYYLL